MSLAPKMGSFLLPHGLHMRIETPAMQDAYGSGDPYLWLAKAGGFAPADATKRTHGELRDTFKVVYLAANYGMGERSLSQLISIGRLQ